MAKTCTVPGCNRSKIKWIKEGCTERKPYVYRMKVPEIKAKWIEAVKPESKALDLPVCDIHFTPADFVPYRRNEHRPFYLRDLGKRKEAVPSMHLDKHLNLAARIKAAELNEPNWWKLLESPKDYNFDIDSVPRPKTVNTVTKQNEPSSRGIDLPPELTNKNDSTISLPIINQPEQISKNTESILKKLRLLLPKPVPPDPVDETAELSPDNTDIVTPENLGKEFAIEVYHFNDVNDPQSTVEYSADSSVQNSEDMEVDSAAQDNSFDNDDYETVTIVAQQKSETKKIGSRTKYKEQQRKLQQKAAENANKRLKLFRTICTIPLKLPSPQWAVQPNFDDNYVVISKVSHSSHGFCVERGICFQSDMSWPDIRINGKVVPSDVLEFTCIGDIERLIEIIDKKIE